MQPIITTRAVLAAWVTATLFVAACWQQGEKIVAEDAPPQPETPEGNGDIACPYVGEPLIDPSTFPPCPACASGGAVCVPKNLLPADKLDAFAECDESSVCVPNTMIETRGNFIPATCESVFGAEGRCLSKCLPTVAPKADVLPQSTCTSAEACVPCYDPFTQEPTGACELSCDPGPAEPAIELQGCCSGDGVCLPVEAVGDKAADLGQDNCAQNEGDKLCVPTEFLEADHHPLTCVDGSILGDAPGVCLPACLPAVQGLLESVILDQEGCPPNHLCAPCDHPITGEPTGACDL